MAIAAVLSHRNVIMTFVAKDSLIKSLKFLATFLAEARAHISLSAELSAIFGSLKDCQWIKWQVGPKDNWIVNPD